MPAGRCPVGQWLRGYLVVVDPDETQEDIREPCTCKPDRVEPCKQCQKDIIAAQVEELDFDGVEANLRQLQGRVRHQCGADCEEHGEVGGIG